MKALLPLIVALLLVNISFSQAKQEFIKSAIVTNSIDNEPLQYTVVELMAKNKSGEKIIISVLTNSNGFFQVKTEVAPSDSLFLVFKSFGFITKRISINNIINNDIGVISLEPVVRTLSGVIVTSNHIKKTINKLTYIVNPKDFTPNSKAVDVMQKVPLVSMIDNSIKVKSKFDAVVFLDGRAITIAEMSLIPAESVKSVEVITNPSSQYDGEFRGSIVNIVSQKNKLDMQRGAADFSRGVNNKWTMGSFYLSYKRKKFLSTISITILDNLQKGGGLLNRQTGSQKFDMSIDNGVNITQTSSSLTTFYEIDSSKLISSKLAYGAITDLGYGNGRYNVFNGAFDTAYNFSSNDTRKVKSYSGDIEYKKTYEGKGFISLSSKYSLRTIARTFDLQNTYYIFSKIKDWNKTNDDITFNELVINGLRNTPLKKNNAIIEYGMSAYFRKYKSNSAYFQYDTVAKIFNNITSFPNGVNLRQNVFALFGTYNISVKDASFSIGSRLEYVNEIFPAYDNNYFKFLPNISAGYNFKKNRYLEFSFAQKLKRPGASYLNPTLFATEPGTISQGNLFLKPEIFYIWQISYNKVYKSRSNINFSLYYEFDTNLIIETTISSSNNIVKQGYQNIAKQHLVGLSFSFTKKLFKIISLNFNSFVEYDKLGSRLYNSVFSNEVYLYSATLNMSTTLLKKYSITGFIAYTNKTFDLYSETTLPASTNLIIRRSFHKNKFSASLRVMFFTNSNERRMVYYDTMLKQISTYYKKNNNLIFTIGYNFGKIFNDSKKRHVGDTKDIKADK